MPFRVFAAGEVLTAANVNDYLAEQAIATFAGTAARASAITAPTEGQFAYLSDSDSLTFYNGSAWVNAGSAIAGTALSSGTATSGQVLTANGSGGVSFGNGGLTLINTTSFSAVSSQSINSVFSSTYSRYRILFDFVGSTNNDVLFRLRVSGTDATGTNYGGQSLYSDATTTGSARYAQTYWYANEIRAAGRYIQEYELFNPQAASQTYGFARSTSITTTDTTQVFQTLVSLGHSLSTAYDGFTFYTTTGTFTGSVQVYGYNK